VNRICKNVDVLSLVIADEVDPELRCPLCGRLFARCSITISSKGAECIFCRETFPLWTQPCPAGITTSGAGHDRQIRITPRSWSAAGIVFAGWFTTIEVLIEVATKLRGASDDPFRHLTALAMGGLIAAPVAGIAAIVYWAMNTYSLAERGSEIELSGRLAGGSEKREFDLGAINAVHLMIATSEQDEKLNVIRLEGVGFYLDLGASLTCAQRTWLALDLLKKSLAAKTRNAACAG
jgi:hypothetical protein